MKSTTDSSVVEKLAENVLETRFEDFDSETLENAKNHIIDTVGCLIGGFNDTGNQEFVNMFRSMGGKEEATILIHGDKVPVCHAAMVNCILARSFDFEPVSPLVEGKNTPGHTSGTTVPSAIAMAESVGASGRDLLTAMIVGDNVASRVLAAAGFGFTLGYDGISLVNPFGTAAIAGRLMGLNKIQMRNAFGLVLNQVGGTLQMCWDGTTAFKLGQGLAARNGILSAQLAKIGWTGPEDPFFSRFGYYNLFTEGNVNKKILTNDLGKKYYSDGTFKPYPCCRMTHAAIDCALAIVNKHGVKSEDIKEVTLYLADKALDHTCSQPFILRAFPHGDVIFSFRYEVATALMKGSVKPEHFTDQAIHDPKTRDFIGKIKLEERPGAEMHSAQLKVVLNDGREVTETCEIPKGDPIHNPISKDELLAKFWTNVEFTRKISREKAGKLLNMVEKLEDLDTVNKMVPLLLA